MATGNEHRRYKRVSTPRMAMIICGSVNHAAYVDDISFGGVRMRNANGRATFTESFKAGDTVIIMIDEMAPLDGRIARMNEEELNIEFLETVLLDRDRIAAEIMSKQEKFGLVDPEFSQAEICG